ADESDPSGIKISTPEADSVIILVQGMGDLQSGAVDFIADFPKVILPDESFEFTYKDHFYRLFARGEKEQIGGQWYTTRNYELFLERDQEERITLLSSFPYFDDSEIVLLFIGDIDQDGGIDLIIDNSPKYNSFSPTLYLSGFVEGDVLVKPVGMSHFFGC
ncbi:MAG: hypothetical protein KDD15_11020, partial [Lewinella sp.]|nr:hypothetical protein [Lewinella sp.]